MASNRWITDVGEFGALVNLSMVKTDYRNESVTPGAMVPFTSPNAAEVPAGYTPLQRIFDNNVWAPGTYTGLPQKAGSPEGIYAQTGPKRLEMRIVIPLVKDVSTQEFVKAIDKGVRRNNGEAEQAALAERVRQFNATIAEVGRVKKGDLLVIDYLPAQGGTVLTVNGQVRGKPVPGHDFYTAFLKVFIGDRNSDAHLRAGLLGQPG